MRRHLAAVLAAAALAGSGAVAHAVELAGSWYVLVHYQDSETNKPEQWRWDDRVWSFAPKGDRLEWAEWPILVLDDESGRFEPMRGGRAARSLGPWEPDAAQLADIRDGVQVNSRGSKTKTLRSASGGNGWSSGESAGADSALVITYSETWTIEGLPEAPVFRRDDTMGGASAETMSGRTEYRTESVLAGGDELTGRFERDGTRTGRFRMIRASGTEGVRTAAKSQQELQRKAGLRALASSDEIRGAIRENVRNDLQASGVTPSDAELEKAVDAAIAAALRSGDADAASKQLAEQTVEMFYSFAARGALHDARARYALPFDGKVPRQLGQGVNGDMGFDIYGNAVSSPQGDPASHVGRNKYGFDWAMPIGTPIVAARDGEVARVVDGFTVSGPQQSLASRANAVFLRHEDGTWSEYLGLDAGIPVQPGQKVRAGDVIAKSGATGSWRGSTGGGQGLHFAVGRLDDDGKPETVEIRFEDGSAAGFVPVPGHYYGAPRGKIEKAEPPAGAAEKPAD